MKPQQIPDVEPADQLEQLAPAAPKPSLEPAVPIEYPEPTPKPGRETSEFRGKAIVQGITAIVGIAAIFVGDLPADAIVEVATWVGGILGVTEAGYAVSRGLAKRGP